MARRGTRRTPLFTAKRLAVSAAAAATLSFPLVMFVLALVLVL
jgi:hypothetical protein